MEISTQLRRINPTWSSESDLQSPQLWTDPVGTLLIYLIFRGLEATVLSNSRWATKYPWVLVQLALASSSFSHQNESPCPMVNYRKFSLVNSSCLHSLLVGGWPTPLKNMKVSEYSSQYMESHKSYVPVTTNQFIIHLPYVFSDFFLGGSTTKDPYFYHQKPPILGWCNRLLRGVVAVARNLVLVQWAQERHSALHQLLGSPGMGPRAQFWLVEKKTTVKSSRINRF